MRPASYVRQSLAAAVMLFAARSADAQGSVRSDVARTVDAELRVATLELVTGRELAALSRLERVATLVRQDSAGTTGPERAALHFLLAQTYYRAGMLEPFRREAEASLAAEPTRYAPILRPQLVIDAYRTGDYARAATLARDLPPSETGLGSFVAGLAAYQTGDLPAARAGFQRALAAGGELATYAKYMDAIAQLRADTTQLAGAVAALENVAASASGAFADQARVTAAQVAYEGDRYADAVRLASLVADSSALAAPALLTRAWALYKLDRVEDAERAFSDFVTRFPDRPERDEAQLMAAQAQLELGRSADAERVFQRIADSAAVVALALQAQTNAAIADVARALVANRAAELLMVADPVGAKALVLRDSSGIGALAVIGGEPAVTPPSVSSAATTSAGVRLDALVPQASPAVSRVLFSRVSQTSRSSELGAGSQRLATEDASVALARFRLQEQLDAQKGEIELLTRLAASVSVDSNALVGLSAEHRTLTDSLARLDQLMASAEARLRQLLGKEIEATRSLAAENARIADSLRSALAGGAEAETRAAIDAEVATAASYARIVDLLTTGLDKAIANHPAFQLRDSLRAHGARAGAALAALQGSYGGSRRGIEDALAALRRGEGPGASAARKALADAEARRAAVEGEVIAAVTAELSARAGEMIAGLQNHTEAAQFGLASAAFFRAIDATRALGGGGSVGATRRPAPERRR